jgi:hypothetical protein
MNNIQLIWFQTTKGHFGNENIYKYTLDNLKKNIDLNYFDKKFLSLKVFNNDEYQEILEDFSNFKYFIWHLEDSRINDESPYKDYAYYLLNNYLADICNFYSSLTEYSEYSYLIEDDSPEIVIKNSLCDFLENGINFLKNNPNIFSINLMRVGIPSEKEYLNHPLTFKNEFSNESHSYNFQNQLFRTEDMIKVVNNIKNKYYKYMNLHTELALETGIRETYPGCSNITYNPRVINSIHIGSSNSHQYIKEYNL